VRTFRLREGATYIAFNKPFQVLCQFSSPPESDKATLADFGLPKGVYPVGRLDFDSEGLLVLSDDGALTEALLPPERRHGKTYLAQVERVPDGAALSRLNKGVMLDGRRTLPADVSVLTVEPPLWERSVPIRFRKNVPTAWLSLTIGEGRNRQVRRMTAAVGHPTLRLVRVAVGSLTLADLGLAPGEWCRLSSGQVMQLFGERR